MARLLDNVTLKVDRPDLGLPAGSQGTVVHVHEGGDVEVEFTRDDGRAAALAAVSADQISAGAPANDSRSAPVTFEVFRTQGSFAWALRAANGQVLARSELFVSKTDCIASIDIVRQGVRTAEVADRTAA